jgi:hypothetical protein
VEQDQGLRAIAGNGVADCSAVDFDEGSFIHDIVSSGRIDEFAIHHISQPEMPIVQVCIEIAALGIK